MNVIKGRGTAQQMGKKTIQRSISSTKKLWMEVHNTVQESVTKTIPKKKTCKEGNWLSEEVLQIAEDWEHMYTHG